MRTRKLAAPLLLALALATGCGDDDKAEDGQAEAEGAAAFPEGEHDESEVVEHLELVEEDGWYYYRADGLDCEIVMVLTGAGTVSMYVDAGDVVATNPDATAGVKITSPDSKACHAAITEAFADF